MFTKYLLYFLFLLKIKYKSCSFALSLMFLAPEIMARLLWDQLKCDLKKPFTRVCQKFATVLDREKIDFSKEFINECFLFQSIEHINSHTIHVFFGKPELCVEIKIWTSYWNSLKIKVHRFLNARIIFSIIDYLVY